MSTRRFVGSSSVILACWLGATFLKEVPAQRYPKLDRRPTTAAVQTENPQAILAAQVKSVVLPVPLSH